MTIESEQQPKNGAKILMAQVHKLISEARITLETLKEKNLHRVFITPSGRDVNQKNHGNNLS